MEGVFYLYPVTVEWLLSCCVQDRCCEGSVVWEPFEDDLEEGLLQSLRDQVIPLGVSAGYVGRWGDSSPSVFAGHGVEGHGVAGRGVLLFLLEMSGGECLLRTVL